jgi:hypothetical protein
MTEAGVVPPPCTASQLELEEALTIRVPAAEVTVSDCVCGGGANPFCNEKDSD